MVLDLILTAAPQRSSPSLPDGEAMSPLGRNGHPSLQPRRGHGKGCHEEREGLILASRKSSILCLQLNRKNAPHFFLYSTISTNSSESWLTDGQGQSS